MGAGQLRVYFGAAPGVGKTYKMLEEGHRRLGRGTDVVIGFVETHGRQRIAELMEGLEVIPRITVTETLARHRGASRRRDHSHHDCERATSGIAQRRCL
jgi:two-component system, OmpR family, sensor histidine kinase KdpD